jgi:hypothetical protein
MNIDTQMLRCSNKSSYEKMKRIAEIVMDENVQSLVNLSSNPDAAVLVETVTMMKLSMECKHCPTEHGSTMVFERPNMQSYPTYLEDVNMLATMSVDVNQELNVRSNPVTSMIISDCMSLIEFADRFENMNSDTGMIVLANFPSLIHAAMLACVFECINAYYNWGTKVKLNMMMDPSTNKSMSRYVGPRRNVMLTESGDILIYLNRLLRTKIDGYMTLITHDDTCARMFMSSDIPGNMDVNMLIPIDTYKKENMVRSRLGPMHRKNWLPGLR